MDVYDLRWYGVLIYGLLGALIIFFIISVSPVMQIYTYEYKAYDNNTGLSNKCSYRSDSWNGQGAMVCELEDGTIVQVMQYKKIRQQSIFIKE